MLVVFLRFQHSLPTDLWKRWLNEETIRMIEEH